MAAGRAETDGSGTLLGAAELDERELTAVARAVTGRARTELRCWWVEPVNYEIGTGSTAGLLRVRGVVADGNRPWSVFVKLLQSYRHTELLATVPAPLRDRTQAMLVADRSWRTEADLYLSDLDDLLPAGLRLPVRYRIDGLGEDRVAEWLEDVRTVAPDWDLPRFARAARLLGRLAVRLTRTDRLPESVSRVAGEVLRQQYFGQELTALPALLGDAIWTHPLLATDAGRRLRADLHRLADRVPTILDALDGLPQTLMHGDASPQNLLVPAAAPDSFVAIDWSLIGLVAVGYDLSQLMIGLTHAGRRGVETLPAVHDAVLPAYVAGLADEGMRVHADVVRFGFHAALVVRSAFSALPLAHLAASSIPDASVVTARVQLTRHLVDLGLALPEAGP